MKRKEIATPYRARNDTLSVVFVYVEVGLKRGVTKGIATPYRARNDTLSVVFVWLVPCWLIYVTELKVCVCGKYECVTQRSSLRGGRNDRRSNL